MILEMLNKQEVDLFMDQHWGKDLVAIKGNPPEGATYSDGDLIVNKINIGWKCPETGEKVDIIYKTK